MPKPKIMIDSIKDQIYEILKGEIISGKLKSGEQLVEQAIADRLNISRSPVREAIKQLTGDGLVANITNKGSFVRRPTIKELGELQEMRQVIEIFAISKIATNMTPSDKTQILSLKEKMLKAKKENSHANFLATERSLWIALVKMADNSYILDTYCKLYAILDNFSMSVISHKPNNFEPSIKERVSILDAMLVGDVETASKITVEHLQNATKIICEAIEVKSNT